MRIQTIFAFVVALGILFSISVSFGDPTGEGRAVLPGVAFRSGSAVLTESSNQALLSLLAELKADSWLRITIEGHTDSIGSYTVNLELSRRRAQAIVDWLVARGVDASRFKIIGYGSSRPIADNHTPQGRALNRRVEIVKVTIKTPVAVLLSNSYQFEPVPDGVEIRHDFVLQNAGNVTLSISRVKTG